MQIKALIVDDESHARAVIRSLLGRVAPDIEVVGEAGNLRDAAGMINALKPDLVFLDIEMPGASGLEIRKHVGDDLRFALVFVTAYDRFAIQALRLSAIDYLLKPVDLTEFKECLDRVRERLARQPDLMQRLHVLEENQSPDGPTVITVQTLQGALHIRLADLQYLEADGMYTVFHLREGREMASKPMKTFEQMLPARYFRIHRSYVVNLDHVQGFAVPERTAILLNSGVELPLARNRKEEFLAAMGWE